MASAFPRGGRRGQASGRCEYSGERPLLLMSFCLKIAFAPQPCSTSACQRHPASLTERQKEAPSAHPSSVALDPTPLCPLSHRVAGCAPVGGRQGPSHSPRPAPLHFLQRDRTPSSSQKPHTCTMQEGPTPSPETPGLVGHRGTHGATLRRDVHRPDPQQESLFVTRS